MNLFDPALAPFTIALLVMAFIAVLELASLAFGASASGVVDNLLPDSDADLAGPEISQPGILDSFLGWLGLGRVPALILLAALLASFGIAGLILQSSWRGLFGGYLPALLPALAAVPLSLFPTRWTGRLLARVLPREESEAISADSFIGKVAVIFRGEATSGRPAEAKLKDPHGATHYLLVEPDVGGERFAAGAEVLIVARDGAVFKAIVNPSVALSTS